MDFLKSLFNPLVERAKSPLYSTFIGSWLIVNWKIVFAVLFFQREDLGHRNLVNFIVLEYINIWECLFFPLFLTIFYIFLMPHIDIRILKYAEKRKREKIDEKIKIGRLHNVQGNLYYDLKLDFEKEKEKVLKIEENINDLKAEIQGEKNTNATLSNEKKAWERKKSELEFEFAQLEYRHQVNKVMKGRWKVTYFDPKDSTASIEHVNIQDYDYQIYDGNISKSPYDIRHFEFDFKSKRITFVKYDKSDLEKHKVVSLSVVNNERFEGTENKMNVVYEMSKYDESKSLN